MNNKISALEKLSPSKNPLKSDGKSIIHYASAQDCMVVEVNGNLPKIGRDVWEGKKMTKARVSK